MFGKSGSFPVTSQPSQSSNATCLVSGEGVGVEAAEYVSHPRAGDGLQDAAALPHAERHLEVLSAPDLHLLVVGADLPEVLAVDGEEAARHGRRPRRRDAATTAAPLVLVLRGDFMS